MTSFNAFRRRSAVSLVFAAMMAPAAAAQDFNGDGFDDLAAGVPNESIGAVAGAGGVNVIYGSAAGLASAGAQFWSQATVGMPNPAEAGDQFGFSLAWGDFNGDRYDDLAVGVPYEDISSVADCGAVVVIYGGPGGLGSGFIATQIWTQGMIGIGDTMEAGDRFGFTMAGGDLNGDGIDDLAIGVPNEGLLGCQNVGAVHVIYGAAGLGLSPMMAITPAQFFHQDSPGVPEGAECGDQFGYALAIGDFNGAAADDLAVGVVSEGFGPVGAAGGANVIYGAVGALGLVPLGGPGAPPAQFWSQDSAGVNDEAEFGDRFGCALAAGDFDGNGADDLAIGAAWEDRQHDTNCGAVFVIYGLVGPGLTGAFPADAEHWFQDRVGVPESTDADDQFGYSLAAGDFNRDGVDDLAIGVNLEDVGSTSIRDAGGVNVIHGALGFGLFSPGPTPPQFWSQNSPGTPEVSESEDRFGESVAAADFNGDGAADLVVGVPGESVGSTGIARAGCVSVFYGSPVAGLSTAGLPAAQVWHQNSAGIPDKAEMDDGFGQSLAR